MRDPDRRSALLAGFAVLGGAAFGDAALAGCSDGRTSTGRVASSGDALTASGAGASGAAAPSSGAAAAGRGSSTGSSAGSGAPSVGASASASASAATELDHATSGRRQVALTFHGDGDPKLALALLKEAEAADARLTVLAVGRWLGAHPEMAKRILDGGHELGNHTETHADITAMSPSAAYAEIEACADRLRKLTGSAGRWFRPSQTQHADAMLVAQARKAGYQTVLSYDVDPMDYQDPPSSATTHRFLQAVQPGAVVSLHLGHPGTVAALPAMLDGLKSRGLAAVTATELFA